MLRLRPPEDGFRLGQQPEHGANLREHSVKLDGGVDALLRHYVNGAGVLAWIENEAGTGYEVPAAVQLRPELQLDKALYEAASTILAAASPCRRSAARCY